MNSDDVDTHYMAGGIGNPNKTVVNESGLYDVILDSRKPQAKRFRRWVTSEVIPTIRKHGGYLTEQKLEEVLFDPDLLINLAQNLKDEQTKRKQLEQQRELDAPKVRMAEAVEASEDFITLTRMSQILNGLGVDMNTAEVAAAHERASLCSGCSVRSPAPCRCSGDPKFREGVRDFLLRITGYGGRLTARATLLCTG